MGKGKERGGRREGGREERRRKGLTSKERGERRA